MKILLQSILIATACYGVVVAGLYVGQRKLLYRPESSLPPLVQSATPEAEVIELLTDDGLSLVSWYLKPRSGMPTVVYFHGNAGTIADRSFKARLFHDAGFGFLLLEYRGYGGNPGQPTEEGLFSDARAGLAFLQDRLEGGALVLYGESLGSGVAVKMAAELAGQGTPAAALILEAPYASIADTAQHHYPFVPVGKLLKDRFDSKSRIRSVKSPLLVVHGDKDKVVPFKHGLKLFDHAQQPKTHIKVPGASHGDLYDFGSGHEIIDFIHETIMANRQ